MTLDEFRATLKQPAAPRGLSVPLLALWYDGRGDWTKAHDTLQDAEDPPVAWVHAYLHRKEGDLGNAGYWYRRARKPPATGSLDDEWNEIAMELIAEL